MREPSLSAAATDASSPDLLLTCRHVGRQWAHATPLRDISFEVHASDFVSIAGTSGAGKSTFLRILGGLDRQYHGQVRLFGQDIAQLSDGALSRLRNDRVALVFQSHQLLPHLTVEENVLLPFAYRSKPRHVPSREHVRSCLDQLGIVDKLSAFPDTLSGGQQQRVAIARALLARPSLLLCDELTGNLDRDTADDVMNVIEAYRIEHHAGIVVVSHDPLVLQRASRRYVLEDGSLRPAFEGDTRTSQGDIL